MGSKKKTARAARAATAASASSRPAKRFDAALWAVLAAALLVRIAYWAASRQSPFYAPGLLDPEYYHEWALRVATGDIATPPVFYGLPLYPFFLGIVYALTGASLEAAKFVQIALGLVTVFFVYRTGEKLSSRTAGLLGAALAAVYGPLFFHEQILTSEAIGVPLYAAAFYFSLRFLDEPSVRRGSALGVLCGLAALTKAGILLFAPFFAIAAFLHFRRAGISARGAVAAFAGAILLTLAPVTAHNAYHGKDFVFLTSHSGFNLYVGNNPKSEGVFVAPEGTGTNVKSQMEDSRAIAERESGRPLKPSEVSKFWSEKAKAFIRENPGRFFWLCKQKLLLFFDAREISDVNDYTFEKGLNPVLRFPWPTFLVLGPLAAAGLVLVTRSTYGATAWIWIGAYLLGMVSFFVNARYRLPLLGIFFPLAGAAVVEARRRLDAKNWAALGLALAAAVWVAWAGQLRLVGADFSRDWVNAGDAFTEKKDFQSAVGYYRKALDVNSSSPKANLAMGVALSGLGRREEAKDFYLTSIALEPSSQAYNNLGMWHNERRDFGEAEACFLKAIKLKGNSPEPYNNLGMIYGNRGDYEKAVEMLQKSLEINPSSPRAHTNLGLALHRLGRGEEAIRHWKKAVEIDPHFPEVRQILSLLEKGVR